VRELQSRELPPRGLALAALFLAAASASAQPVGLHVAPADPATESARGAAAAAAPHVAELFGVAPLAELGPATVEAPGRLAELAAWNRTHRSPLQNGFARPLPAPRRVDLAVDPAAAQPEPPGSAAKAAPPAPVVERDGGVLAQTSFSTVTWGGKVRVGDASRLRLHLSRVSLPAGARLWVHGAGRTAGPFGEELIGPDGGLWTPSVEGEEVALDVEMPAAALAAGTRYGFTIDEALELVPTGGASAPEAGTTGTSCEVDASCFGSRDFPAYDAARHAVARLEFVESHAGFLCTGQLLNDAASDGAPFLLTAHHCISTQDVASTLQAVFDDFTPSCNGTPPDLATLPTATGATLLVTGRADSAPDFTLLRLASLPSGRTFLGWDPSPRAAANGTRLYRISHPSGDSQMFSVSTADSQAAQCTEDNLPLPRFIYSDLAVGTVSGGSSGSAAMLAGGQVVGQLLGSCGFGDPCNPRQHTVDGALSVSFDQLQPFLSPGVAGACAPGDLKLCLVHKRFQVQVTWANQFDGSAGVAHAIVGTDETGYFFFTDPSNYELIVKILDFGAVFKVFYAELTDLHFTITVADSQTGLVKTYTNTPGDCGGIDGAAFPAGAAGSPSAAEAMGGMSADAAIGAMRAGAAAGELSSAAAGETAAAGESSAAAGLAASPAAVEASRRSCGGALCLLAGRFAVGVHWMNQFSGASGEGRARTLSDSSGLFTFGDPSNVELVLKIVPFFNRVAFFYAALSNLEYDITVADNASGSVKTYHNPAGNYCGGIDDHAFPP
jgi:lysyl endopeptidase